MDLFDTLSKKQRRNKFLSSEEMTFFLNYNGFLSDYKPFERLRKAEEPFDVIRANVIIRSILNKKAIEEAFAKAKRKEEDPEEAVFLALANLPYFKDGEDKIYLPIFSKSLNKIYVEHPSKLALQPYNTLINNVWASSIDPFDYYGPSLFDSYFTKLIAIKKHKETIAYLDYDSSSIFFVNWQGRLDARVALFDKYLDKPSANHLLERVLPAVNCYFNEDREGFLKALVDNKLISSRLIYKINFDEEKANSKLGK